MSSIDELKNTLKTSKDILNVIKTMKNVTMVNIRDYESSVKYSYYFKNNIELAIHALVKYCNLEDINNMKNINLSNIKRKNKDIVIEKTKDGGKNKNLIIIIGSNQGLCGRYNDRILDFMLNNIKESEQNRYITLGDKMQMLMEHNKKFNIVKSFSAPSFLNLVNNVVFSIIKLIEDEFKNNLSNKVYLYYTKYDEITTNGTPIKLRLFDINKKNIDKYKEKKWITKNIPVWRLDEKKLFFNITQKYIFVSISDAIINSVASELKSRLLTLQNTDKSIENIIKIKQLEYNQKRQSLITNELLDIVNGFKVTKK
ncbi:MAG: F0F1 ATP synthase subunit gamma [Rickettsiales bacterium]|jgi:F-type H+-transporting ATPase subunit gamma|nr:F0F1 ATP synthase subunit gamma [Rickettsiales bacterium]